MNIRAKMVSFLAPRLRNYPQLKNAAKSVDVYVDVLKHSTAAVLPNIIQPDPREIYITLTANCNLRCIGCHYGRDFMAGSQPPLPPVRDLLDHSQEMGRHIFLL